MSNYVKSIPMNEERVILQARVSKKDLDKLKKANVDIPELIRQAVREAASMVKKS